jgi:ABC-type phosphate transport system substrate-binding protein
MDRTSPARRGRRGRIAVFGVAVVALALAATSAVGVARAATPTKPVTILGSGSDVTFHVMSSLDLLYNESPGCNITVQTGTQPLDFTCQPPSTGDVTSENYLHDRATEAYPIGGGAGIKQLCAQGTTGVAAIQYARQTSAPDATVCTGLNYLAYGRDGITWETWPNVAGSATNGVNNLTTAQLQGIYVNCSITNWNQVGGANAPIIRYSIQSYYGTRKAFDGFLGGSSSSCAGTKLIDQTANQQVPAADRATAIVPVSIGSWTERFGPTGVPDGSKLGSIDGVTPTEAHVADGSFTFSRFLYNVTCVGVGSPKKCGTAKPALPGTVKYVGKNGWLCTANAHVADPVTGDNYRDEITQTIRNFGFAPLPVGPQGGGSTLTNYCRFAKT